nr:MFS transporter [Mycolicibacterium sp. 018/SC-01/001]
MDGPGGVRRGTAAGRWVLFATVLGSAMVMIDSTVVNVALPHISRELHADFGGVQWIINAYTLTLAGLILLGGSLGDRFGRRRIFLVGVVWFAVASAACGFAPNIDMLIIARALQGVGGALLTPGSLALISASFDGADRGAAIGTWSGLGGLAGAVGPFLGGPLAEWNWRAVFIINLPLAVVVVIVAVLRVPESRDTRSAPGLDGSGTVLAALGLGALTVGLTELGRGEITSSATAAVGVGVSALAVFAVAERRSAHPLIPPSLFNDNTFRVANAITLLVYGALSMVFLVLVLQLQTVAGFTATAAGAALLPMTAMLLLFSSRAGALAARIGLRLPLCAGLILASGGLLLMLRIGTSASWLFDVLPAALIFGAGMSLVVAPLTSAALDSAPDHLAGAASGVNNAIARAGGLIAVAVIPGLAGIGDANYIEPTIFAAGFRRAVVIVAGIFVLAAVLAVVGIKPRSAAEIQRRRLLLVEQYPHCPVNGPSPHPSCPRMHP